MKTKEAIEFVDMKICESPKKDQLFNLLKRGEKYKEMWGELEGFFEPGKIFEVPEEYLGQEGGVMQYIVKSIKEKYFPKPKIINWKDRFYELEEEFEEREKELIYEIEHWKYLYHNKQH